MLYYESYHTELRRQLHHIEYLFEKGLYQHAGQLIKKAITFAHTYEMYFALGEIYQFWALPLYLRRQDHAALRRGLKEWEECLLKQQNLQAFLELSYRVAIYHSSRGLIREKEHSKELNILSKHPLLQNEKQALHFTSQVLFHNISGVIAETRGDHQKKYLHFKKAIDLFGPYPEKARIPYFNYLARINNYLMAASDLGQYGGFDHWLEKIRQFRPFPSTRSARARQFYYYYSNLLHFRFIMGEAATLEKDLPDLTDEFRKFESALTLAERIILAINLASVCLASGEYRRCLYWINKIRNETAHDQFPDVHATLQLLFLLVHFESGSDDEFLRTLIKADKYYLSKRKRLYRFENIMLDFFRKDLIGSSRQPSVLKEKFRKLQTLLQPLGSDPLEKNAFRYFDFRWWVESRVRQIPLSSLLREKHAG